MSASSKRSAGRKIAKTANGTAATGLPIMPCFLPSVSSVKTNLAPVDYVRALRAIGVQAYLVSAYDIDKASAKERREIAAALAASHNAGHNTLIDSGNYESYWKADKRWKPAHFHAAVSAVVPPGSLVLCHDNQRPPANVAEVVDGVVRAIERDRAGLPDMRLQPIVHAAPSLLPKACAKIAAKLKSDLLAVPERLLGEGLLARARTLIAVRRELDQQLGYRRPLHILGTGNPRSLLILTACGADSFDGLEWCQTVVDHEHATLHHFQHYDLFAWQSPYANLEGVGFTAKVLAHNLAFYADWIERLRGAAATGALSAFAKETLPSGIFSDLATALPEVFKA